MRLFQDAIYLINVIRNVSGKVTKRSVMSVILFFGFLVYRDSIWCRNNFYLFNRMNFRSPKLRGVMLLITAIKKISDWE